MSREWEDAPVTYSLDFHHRLMDTLLNNASPRERLILFDELNRVMGVSARKRLHRSQEDARAQESAPTPKTLEELQTDARRARADLRARVLGDCPGIHRVTQHRDRKPPWCHDCGRDAEGNQMKEVQS